MGFLDKIKDKAKDINENYPDHEEIKNQDQQKDQEEINFEYETILLGMDPDPYSNWPSEYDLFLISDSEMEEPYTLFKSKYDMEIPEGTKIVPVLESYTLYFNEQRIKFIPFLLVHPDKKDKLDEEGKRRAINFPENIQGKTIPETECIDQEFFDFVINSCEQMMAQKIKDSQE